VATPARVAAMLARAVVATSVAQTYSWPLGIVPSGVVTSHFQLEKNSREEAPVPVCALWPVRFHRLRQLVLDHSAEDHPADRHAPQSRLILNPPSPEAGRGAGFRCFAAISRAR
jgi:hypothetical protein